MLKRFFFHFSKNLFYARNLIAGFCLVSFMLGCYVVFSKLDRDTTKSASTASSSYCNYFMPIVKFHGVSENERTLDLVKQLFQKMGYRIHTHDQMKWDIMWSHTYPFYSLAQEMAHLRPTQKVNHFPGSGFITQKSNLAALRINHIPKSFFLPNDKTDFVRYVARNPTKFWILKSSTHRGMKLMNGTENLDAEGSFIQEFIRNPLLINRKKFDVGIYVILTSVDPLRVYVYSGDILLRFCKQNYYPLNIHIPESYIVGDDYLPVWEVPDLKFYYSELNYTAKESLNEYLQSKGKSTKRIWAQIYETIKDVYLQTEDNVRKSAMSLGSLRNFFELVRFDFIIDEDLNVFLLEVNMSPNLSPAHFPQNKLLYEPIIFNSLSIVGLIRKFPDSFTYRFITRDFIWIGFGNSLLHFGNFFCMCYLMLPETWLLGEVKLKYLKKIFKSLLNNVQLKHVDLPARALSASLVISA